MGWAAFWVIFSQTHLVTLIVGRKVSGNIFRGKFRNVK
jgi:hypothetical protein